jgi:hypothetical protein
MPRKKTAVMEKDEEVEEQKETLLTEAIEELEEPPVVVATESVPKRYIANLYWEKEPYAKDIYAGSYVYWESTQTITWEALSPQYSTDLELLSGSDILVTKEGRSYLISRWETPKEWLINLPFATLGQRYICKDVVELYETE